MFASKKLDGRERRDREGKTAMSDVMNGTARLTGDPAVEKKRDEGNTGVEGNTSRHWKGERRFGPRSASRACSVQA